MLPLAVCLMDVYEWCDGTVDLKGPLNMGAFPGNEGVCAAAEAEDASGSASGTSSDEDEASNGNPAGPGQGVSPEQIIVREVHEIIDSSHGVEAIQFLDRGGKQAAFLRAHVDSLFKENTEEGSRMKLGDWTLYCRLVYSKSIPETKDVQWPASAECWVCFLLVARVHVSSHKRFQGVVGNVCEVADRFWSKVLCVRTEVVDPRLLFSAEHSRTMYAIKREHGMGIKQVMAVAMDEARIDPFWGCAAR